MCSTHFARMSLLSSSAMCWIRLMVPLQILKGIADVNVSSNNTLITTVFSDISTQHNGNTKRLEFGSFFFYFTVTLILIYCNFESHVKIGF